MIDLKNISTFFVSQVSGNDLFSGTSPKEDKKGNGPYKTVERAVEVIKGYRQIGYDRPITISFVDDYFLSCPIDLSGLYGVTLSSYGQRKRIVGGVCLSNWKKSEFNGKPCLCAYVPENISIAFTDLYVNGERAKVTRFPKGGTLRIADAENCLKGKHVSSEHIKCSSKWFLVDPDDLSGIDNVEDAIINYNHFWVDEHSPIESYDKNNGKLVMKYTSRFAISSSYDENPNAAPQYYLSHIPNCFEEKGQWYLDRKTRTVYYIPTSDDISHENIEAVAPISDRLFVISGEDIFVRDLELTCTKSEYVSTVKYHYTDKTPDSEMFASDIQSACYAPGAILFKNAKRCGIYNCDIHGAGVYGIEILCGCDNIRIENNRIYDLSAGGIRICGGDAEELVKDKTLAVSNCIIRNNRIYECDKRYLAGCGILIMHANNCEISENEIYDLEYSGISVGWIWGYSESTTYGCIIKKNHIYNIGKGNLSDLGAIYLLGKQRGTVVSENRIHDVKCFSYGAWGIYLDEGSSYVSVERNVVYRTGRECFHLHYGSHNTVRGNLLFGGDTSCIRVSKEEDHDQILFEENVFITDNSPIYGVIKSPQRLLARRNTLWSTENKPPILWINKDGNKYDLERWQKHFGNDWESVIADPKIDIPLT
ncbi:MAG: right-handed parallel beta-helix repeat-containing protein [Ruminococcaceae bacterium]|nr:right-handed parallel beta-helix repeat-containing protein [Oscillospiraceae bacterium]